MSKSPAADATVEKWVGSGLALGVALGAALGNVGMGIAVGLAIGAGIGWARRRPNADDADGGS